MLTALPLVAALAISLAGGYLLGSIPFGLLVTRFAGGGAIRAIGSGSIGATNVLRTGRRDLALISLIGDAGKGALAAVLAGWLFSPPAATVAAGAAFVGHLFPMWLKFKGGKGVATAFGILIALAWPAGLAAGAIWLTVAVIFRISSLAALVAAAVGPVFVLIVSGAWDAHATLALFMGVLVFVRHWQNITRLLRGAEPRIGAGAHQEAT